MRNLNLTVRKYLLGPELPSLQGHRGMTLLEALRLFLGGQTHEALQPRASGPVCLEKVRVLLDVRKADVDPGTAERAKYLASSFSEGLECHVWA